MVTLGISIAERLTTGSPWREFWSEPPYDTPDAKLCGRACGSEALPVDNRGAGLVVLRLRDPHLLEGAQGRQDGAADPDRVLALGRRHDLDLHGGGRQGRELLGHPLAD